MKHKTNSSPSLNPTARSVSSEVPDNNDCPFFGQIFRCAGQTNDGFDYDRIYEVVGRGDYPGFLMVKILWADENEVAEVGSVRNHTPPDERCYCSKTRPSSLEEAQSLPVVPPCESVILRRANPNGWCYDAAYG